MAKLIQEATEKIPEIRKNLRQEATYDETHTLRPIIAFVSNFKTFMRRRCLWSLLARIVILTEIRQF